MKKLKLVSILSSALLAVSATPILANAENTAPVEPEFLQGDVNLDGAIDASDATLILRYYGEKGVSLYYGTDDWEPGENYSQQLYYQGENTVYRSRLTAEQRANVEAYGDADGNGYVDGCDATVVLRIYAERDLKK